MTESNKDTGFRRSKILVYTGAILFSGLSPRSGAKRGELEPLRNAKRRKSIFCRMQRGKQERKIEGAEAEATARVWTHKICLPRKKDRRKRNNQWSNRNGRRKVANRNSVVVLQISAVFSFSYLCVYGAPRCALRGHGFVFFLEQGPLTGSRKIGTYLGPLKITLPLLSSLPDLLLS